MSYQNSQDNQDSPEEIIRITDPNTDRYHVFGLISWWKPEIVHNATVLVVGAGALGNEVLKNLALMGVGRILIIDFDRIETHNLSRSVLYRPEDVNQRRPKAQVAAEAVKTINPDVKVHWLNGDISFDVGMGIFRRVDVVIGCLDNRWARLWVNRYSLYVNKPWVDGGIADLMGEVKVFTADYPCYECSLAELDWEIINLRNSCPALERLNLQQGRLPTTPTIASIIGALQTQEALKLLHNLPTQPGKILVVNGFVNDFYLTALQENEKCQSHWVWEPITELSDRRSDNTTLQMLLEIARQDLGPEAVVRLADGGQNRGRSFVLNHKCEECGSQTRVFQPLHRVSLQSAVCPVCQPRLAPEADLDNLNGDEPFLRSSELALTDIDGDEEFLDLTLAELGIPPLHIIYARDPVTGAMRYYELTGDAVDFFRFE